MEVVTDPWIEQLPCFIVIKKFIIAFSNFTGMVLPDIRDIVENIPQPLYHWLMTFEEENIKRQKKKRKRRNKRYRGNWS
jgi:hypothetical protein